MMGLKKYTLFLMLLTATITTTVLTGCNVENNANSTSPSKSSSEGTYQKLEQSTAKENLDSNKDILLVDVRTPEEFEEVRIPNSILIPDYDLEKLASEILPDKDALIYVYCRSGNRSKSSTTLLAELGYTNVYDIGGIIDWDYETISGKP